MNSARGARGAQSSSTLVLSENRGSSGFAMGSFTELAEEFRTMDPGKEDKTRTPYQNSDRTRATPTSTLREDSEKTAGLSPRLKEETSGLDVDGVEPTTSRTPASQRDGLLDVEKVEHQEVEEPAPSQGPAFFFGLGGGLRRHLYTDELESTDVILKISRIMGHWAWIHWMLAIAGHFLGWEGWSHVIIVLALCETIGGSYVDYYVVRLLARLAHGDLEDRYGHPEDVCSTRWQFFGCDTCLSVWMVSLIMNVCGAPDELLDAGVVGLTFGEGPWSVTPNSTALIDDLGIFGWIFHIGIGWALLVALNLSLCLQAWLFFGSKRRADKDAGVGNDSSSLSCLVDMADIANLNMSSEVIKRMKVRGHAGDFSNNACFYTKTLPQNSLQLCLSVSLLQLIYKTGDRREVANVLLAIATGTAVTLASTKSFVMHGLMDSSSSHCGIRCCCGLIFVVPVVVILLTSWWRLICIFL